jgi:hypothetical protein
MNSTAGLILQFTEHRRRQNDCGGNDLGPWPSEIGFYAGQVFGESQGDKKFTHIRRL